MPWAVLLVSAVFEAVWATALGESDGLSRLGPTVVFVIFSVISLVGLGWAMKTIPTGTAYAVWTGLGAVLTVVWAVVTGEEALTPLKALFLVGIIGCAVGLKFATAPRGEDEVRVSPGQRTPTAGG
ncbi:multidrug efflux SMR transporter [Ornithinimicrobium sp. F0845]|uniref:DMT family transporter n=1 Tax=Ornithinimicrobium sp. F0845 TaxID=2926412 RepID=UPI001FF304E3|nr:multidrug efflux SMR transporter [Ornithinimicrobium sp. F0845]MCK0113422.1 multidrug efflux SMR transporter [Ornithinimicrobium sp. F0845]